MSVKSPGGPSSFRAVRNCLRQHQIVHPGNKVERRRVPGDDSGGKVSPKHGAKSLHIPRQQAAPQHIVAL